MQRVEQAFQDLSDQGGSVRLRLSPPELGSLHIEISVAKGEMTARVQAETPAARNILLDNLPALRERLAQHDIKVQSFDVDLMDRSGGGMSNQSSQYQNPSQQNSGGTVVRTPFRGSSELPARGRGGRLPPREQRRKLERRRVRQGSRRIRSASSTISPTILNQSRPNHFRKGATMATSHQSHVVRRQHRDHEFQFGQSPILCNRSRSTISPRCSSPNCRTRIRRNR